MTSNTRLTSVALLSLLAGCLSPVAQIAKTAHWIYREASDVADYAIDDSIQKEARACAYAALTTERAAIEAQEALIDDSPDYGRKRAMARDAEKKMRKLCDPLHIDGTGIPPQPVDMRSDSSRGAAHDLAPRMD